MSDCSGFRVAPLKRRWLKASPNPTIPKSENPLEIDLQRELDRPARRRRCRSLGCPLLRVLVT